MKKGTLVKFIGTETRQPIEKTYIWAVVENLYLIEHPQGTEFKEETKKDFEGFDTSKLTIGKRYLLAHPQELIDLTAPAETVTNTVVETITVTMPKEYFEQVKDFMTSQKEQCQSNPIVKMQLGADFDNMINFYDELIKASDNALAQEQAVEPKLNAAQGFQLPTEPKLNAAQGFQVTTEPQNIQEVIMDGDSNKSQISNLNTQI